MSPLTHNVIFVHSVSVAVFLNVHQNNPHDDQQHHPGDVWQPAHQLPVGVERREGGGEEGEREEEEGERKEKGRGGGRMRGRHIPGKYQVNGKFTRNSV